MKANRELRGAIIGKYGNLANFAEIAGVHVSQLSFVLAGQRKIDKARATAWRKILECPEQLVRPLVREN